MKKVKKFEKLLQVDVDYSDKIDNITISGDFFIHPEDFIQKIEKMFLKKNEKEIEKLKQKIDKEIKNKKVMIIGFSVDNLVNLVLEGVKDEINNR